MAIRATTNAEQAYEEIKAQLSSLRKQADERQATLATDTGAYAVMRMAQELRDFRNRMTAVEGVTGLAEYAETAEADPTYDVIAEWTSLKALIDAAIAQILADFPTSAGGFMEAATLNADGTVTERIFPAANLVSVRDAIIAVRDFITVS